NHLKHRQIDVSQLRAGKVALPALITRQQRFEVAEKLRQPILQKILGPPPRFLLLVFVIQTGADRMVGVVNLDQKIGEGQLQLMRPEPAGLLLRGEPETRAQEQQDVGRLADHQPTGLQERRCEGAVGGLSIVENAHEGGDPEPLAALARYVDILGTRLLQREPHVFAATLDLWPVEELVDHTARLGNPDAAKPYLAQAPAKNAPKRGFTMTLTVSMGPVIALIAGILILIAPRLLNYIVAIYLILIGVLGLFGGSHGLHV